MNECFTLLESSAGAKLADYFGYVLMLGVYGQVHGSHVVSGDFAGEAVEGHGDLGPAAEGVFADQGDGFVGWEVVAVVLKGQEVEFVYGSVGGVAGYDVYLVSGQGAVEEA